MLNVAVIGVGNMGKHHARVYSEIGCSLQAVCDLDEARAKEAAEKVGCNFYKDYREMLEREQIDAVSVAVPTRMHKDVALYCIDRGKHVLVEKPISDNVEDAVEMIGAAKKKGVRLAVGHVERFNPAVRKLKEIIKSGELGKITTIIARRVGIFPPQIKDSNVIIDIAVHDIDILNYFLEKTPTGIYARSGKALVNSRDDYADIFLNYGGTNALVQVNWITPVKIRNVAITGTKGYAELNYITQELILYKNKYKREFDTFTDVVEFAKPDIITLGIEREEPLKLELIDFVNAVKNSKRPLVTGEDGLAVLEIALKAIEAAKR